MCQIFHIPKNVSVPEHLMLHSILNNPHGWGSVIRRDGKLEVRKETGVKNDPDKIMKWIDKHKDEERFLHFRWRTKGSLEKMNCHPFEVYRKGSRRILMMHNGTLGGFTPRDPLAPESDTYNFNQRFLKPFFKRYTVEGEKGVVDDLAMDIIHKFVDSRSRVLLIPSDQPVCYFNNFHEPTGNEWVSANSYTFTPNYRGQNNRKNSRTVYGQCRYFGELSKYLKKIGGWSVKKPVKMKNRPRKTLENVIELPVLDPLDNTLLL